MIHREKFQSKVESVLNEVLSKGYKISDVKLQTQWLGNFRVNWCVEKDSGEVISDKIHEVDFFDHSIAQLTKDPRNLTIEEHQFLELYRHDIVENYGSEKWDELIKGAIAKARNKGNIVNGPGEGKSQRRDNFNPGAFMS